MKREIKFRALMLPERIWVYGSLISDSHECLIKKTDSNFVRVESNSVGQFTGLKDKNGIDIYEGDILYKQSNPEYTKKEYCKLLFKIEFDTIHGCFRSICVTPNISSSIFWPHIYECEVIGNIYQNLELI